MISSQTGIIVWEKQISTMVTKVEALRIHSFKNEPFLSTLMIQCRLTLSWTKLFHFLKLSCEVAN